MHLVKLNVSSCDHLKHGWASLWRTPAVLPREVTSEEFTGAGPVTE